MSDSNYRPESVLLVEYLDIKNELARANEKIKLYETALGFDYEYYEAKPHKCLSLLIELKEALAKGKELT